MMRKICLFLLFALISCFSYGQVIRESKTVKMSVPFEYLGFQFFDAKNLGTDNERASKLDDVTIRIYSEYQDETLCSGSVSSVGTTTDFLSNELYFIVSKKGYKTEKYKWTKTVMSQILEIYLTKLVPQEE